jgi:hypothetical protein
MATFPSKVNYATGDILTATNMNDVGGAINLLDGAQFAAGKNKVINGDFGVWQRGTSFTGTGNYFVADRFQGYRGAAAAGGTWSRQTASLDGFQFAMRVQRNSGNTATDSMFLTQSFETNAIRPFYGNKVTVSFWARAGANFSSAAANLGISIVTGTGTEATLTSGFTGTVSTALTGATLTTSWQRFSATTSATIANTATQFALQLGYNPVGTAGANDYFDITGIQMEAANTASNFQTATGTLQGELAACQRYYVRFAETSSSSDWMIGFGTGFSTTGATIQVKHPVTMRVYPSSVDFSLLAIQDGTNSRIAVTNLTLSERSKDLTNVNVTVASGATQYRPYFLSQNSNATGYLGFNAEL